MHANRPANCCSAIKKEILSGAGSSRGNGGDPSPLLVLEETCTKESSSSYGPSVRLCKSLCCLYKPQSVSQLFTNFETCTCVSFFCLGNNAFKAGNMVLAKGYYTDAMNMLVLRNTTNAQGDRTCRHFSCAAHEYVTSESHQDID